MSERSPMAPLYVIIVSLFLALAVFLALWLRLSKDRAVTVRVFCSSTSQIIERATAPTTFDVTCER